jgi:hypothetical protein
MIRTVECLAYIAASLQQGDYLQRRQDRANRRVNAAVKSLATVRRLALPIRVDVTVAGSVETKPAEPTHPVLPNWDRVPSANCGELQGSSTNTCPSGR